MITFIENGDVTGTPSFSFFGFAAVGRRISTRVFIGCFNVGFSGFVLTLDLVQIFIFGVFIGHLNASFADSLLVIMTEHAGTDWIRSKKIYN